jgi:prepilin-type N-terminal cleavage/methylation domain-containing protein
MRKGFTLLETLVAVAVLGTAVAATMGALSGALRNESRAEDYERIVLLSRAQMNELMSLPSWKDGQVWRGDWNSTAWWKAKVQRVPETGGIAQQNRELLRLLLTATWKTTRGEKALEFETVRLQIRRPE